MTAIQTSNPYVKNNQESKNDDGDESKSYELKNLWRTFRETAKQVGTWAEDFLEQLQAAPLKEETKKEIAKVCRTYNDLLSKTSFKLQAYRKEVEKIITVFDNLVDIMVPPEDVKSDLAELSESEKVKEINRLCNLNKDSFKAQLTRLQHSISDKKSIDDLLKLKEEWGTLGKDIEKVLSDVDSDLRAFRKKMGIVLGCVFVFAAVVGGAALFLSGGTAAAAIAPLLSTVGVYALGALAGLAVLGVAALGVLMIVEPEVAKALKVLQNDTLGSITAGLDHIALQSQRMQDILQAIALNWLEIADTDLENKLKESWGKVKVDELLKALEETKQGLKELKLDIEETEVTVNEEIRTYADKVYKPLLGLWH